MTLTLMLIVVASLLGFYLGREAGVRRHREELGCLQERYRKVIDFADAYIEANAPIRALHVIRDEEGHIVDLLMRCGTSAILATEMQEERRRRQGLH